MSKIEANASTLITVLLGGIASIALVVLWGGFWSALTFSTLWAWFVVPLFNLPVLSMLQAYGVALAFRACKGLDTKKQEKEELSSVLARMLVVPPLASGVMLLVGWVVKSWM